MTGLTLINKQPLCQQNTETMKTITTLKLKLAAMLMTLSFATVAQVNCTGNFTTQNNGGGSFTFNPNCNFPANLSMVSYYWYFGDGSSGSTVTSPTHQYTYNGTFIAEMYAFAYDPNDSTQYCYVYDVDSNVTVTNAPGGNCYAGFGFFLDSLNQNMAYFYPTQSSGTLSYSWSFGDGSTSTQMYPTHTYAAPGNYQVCLVVTDAVNMCSDSLCSSVTILGGPSGGGAGCNMNAYVFAQQVNGLNYNIAGFATGNQVTNNMLFIWQTNSYFYGTNQVNFTFPSAGYYDVCYYAEDSSANSYCYDSTCVQILVGAPTCQANFVLIQDSLNPTTWYAIDYSTGSNLSYYWSFGDGSGSTQQFPTHTYAQSGNYDVCLYITNGTCSDSLCDTSSVQRFMAGMGMQHLIVKPWNSVTGIHAQHLDAVEMSVFPNPVNSQSSIRITTDKTMLINANILDATGRLIRSEKLGLIQGENTHRLNNESLESGVYLLQLTDENSRTIKTIRFVK